MSDWLGLNVQHAVEDLSELEWIKDMKRSQMVLVDKSGREAHFKFVWQRDNRAEYHHSHLRFAFLAIRGVKTSDGQCEVGFCKGCLCKSNLLSEEKEPLRYEMFLCKSPDINKSFT
jgi:hypothetical protein